MFELLETQIPIFKFEFSNAFVLLARWPETSDLLEITNTAFDPYVIA